MKRYLPISRVNFCSHFIPYFIAITVSIALLASLSSCDAGSKGRYKFQSESMHWLQFRGPNASGIAPENADPPIHFSADTNLLWETDLMAGWSSPCIVNDKIFLTGFNDADSLLYTMAINRENGEVLWRDSLQPLDFYDLHPVNGYANPTVASDGERIFSMFPGFGVVAYNLTGDRNWEYKLKSVSRIRWGGASSPVVLDSLLILDISNFEDPRILALDCVTGDTAWTIREQNHRWGSVLSRATPVLWNDLIILHHSGEIIAFNLQNGTLEWWLSTLTSSVGTPVIKDDILYVNTWTNMGEKSLQGKFVPFIDLVREVDKNGNGKVERDELSDDMKIFQRPERTDSPESSIALNAEWVFSGSDENSDGSLEESEWDNLWDMAFKYYGDHGMLALSIEGSGERPVTDIIWKIADDTPETPSPLVINSNVFFIKSGGIMTVVNRETGEVVHKDRVGASGSYLASPMLAGNRIYTCSYNGTVTVLSADDFRVIAQNNLGERIGASPVAVDDVLYIRTDKHLYAFRDQ
jgi:outer membrane protein assembly factor BamB